MAMNFGAPQVGKDQDIGKFKKLAQRVEETLNNLVIFKEPKQLDPRAVLVAPLNRDGAPPNRMHIHNRILKSFKTQGYDRTRPQVGICVEYKTAEGKAKLLEHNRRFSKGETLLPPIHEDLAMYGSLAGSHLNLALRCIQSGCTSPQGDISALVTEDESLKEVVMNGHRWWVLPEQVPPERQLDISQWRNQDQNENQGTHEIEIIQTIAATAESIVSTQKKIIMSDLIARASKRNPAKISPLVLSTLTKFYVQFLESGDAHLVKELVDFHASRVNPGELCVPNTFFQSLTSEELLLKTPYLRHFLLLTQYTDEKVRAQAGSASMAAFLDSAFIQSLAKKPDVAIEVEKK